MQEEVEEGSMDVAAQSSSCDGLSRGAAAAVHPHPAGMDEQVRWS